MFTCDVIKARKLNTLTLATRFITNFHKAPFPTRSMGKTLRHVRITGKIIGLVQQNMCNSQLDV